MKRRLLILSVLILTTPVSLSARIITEEKLRSIYEEVKTPYKYGLVITPQDDHHQCDCPIVFRKGKKWLMTYVIYNGKGGHDGRGYETWLSESDDLLHWRALGRVLSYHDGFWDENQRAGYPALIDWKWGGSYKMAKYKGLSWMSYFGGKGRGYEITEAPLKIGMAWTNGDISKQHEWNSTAKPVMDIDERQTQWWEKITHYKPTVYRDKQKTLGKEFVMFYNACGVNPTNNIKAERIGIALSDDMLSWTRYDGNPVFAQETDNIITGDAQIVKMGKLFVMFYYQAHNPSRGYQAYNTFAVSENLTDWTPWNGDDLVFPSETYDERYAHKSYVLKHKGVVYHFYCAVDFQRHRGIAVATSKDLGKSNLHF